LRQHPFPHLPSDLLQAEDFHEWARRKSDFPAAQHLHFPKYFLGQSFPLLNHSPEYPLGPEKQFLTKAAAMWIFLNHSVLRSLFLIRWAMIRKHAVSFFLFLQEMKRIHHASQWQALHE